MNKKIALISILISFLILIPSVFPQSGVNQICDTNSSTYGNCLNYSYNRGIYYVNDLYWSFSIDAQFLQAFYSSDNMTWTEVNTGEFPAGWIAQLVSSGSATSYRLDTYYDGTYFYYAYLKSTGVGIFRRGTLDSDGGITWSTAQQTWTSAGGSANAYYISLTVDSEGYPYIGYYAYLSLSDYLVYKSSTNDGTLIEEYEIAVEDDEILGDSAGCLTADEDSLVYLTYCDNKTLKIYSSDDTFGSLKATLSGTLKQSESFCARTYNGTLHIAYLDSSDYICYAKFENNQLMNETQLEAVSSLSYPTLTIDTVTYDIYICWLEGQYARYIKFDYSEQNFDSEEIFSVLISDLFDNQKQLIMNKDYDNHLGMVFHTGASGEYVSFVDLELNPSRVFEAPEGESVPIDYNFLFTITGIITIILILILGLVIKQKGRSL